VIVGALIFIRREINLRPRFASIIIVLLSFSIPVSGLTVSVFNYGSKSQRQQNEWMMNDVTYRTSEDYVVASRWIKLNSGVNEVVATKVTSRSPNLAELTDRKEYAGFDLLMRVAGSYSNYETVKRKFIADFSVGGDCGSAEGLRANEVAYVLVDLTNPDTPDVERCAKEVFRNETVIVYSLK
jgi:hypothetical protein